MTNHYKYGIATVAALGVLALPFVVAGNRFLGFVLGMTLISLLWATGMTCCPDSWG